MSRSRGNNSPSAGLYDDQWETSYRDAEQRRIQEQSTYNLSQGSRTPITEQQTDGRKILADSSKKITQLIAQNVALNANANASPTAKRTYKPGFNRYEYSDSTKEYRFDRLNPNKPLLAAPVTFNESQPIPEPIAAPLTRPTTGPTTGPITEPITEPVDETVIDPAVPPKTDNEDRNPYNHRSTSEVVSLIYDIAKTNNDKKRRSEPTVTSRPGQSNPSNSQSLQPSPFLSGQTYSSKNNFDSLSRDITIEPASNSRPQRLFPRLQDIRYNPWPRNHTLSLESKQPRQYRVEKSPHRVFSSAAISKAPQAQSQKQATSQTKSRLPATPQSPASPPDKLFPRKKRNGDWDLDQWDSLKYALEPMLHEIDNNSASVVLARLNAGLPSSMRDQLSEKELAQRSVVILRFYIAHASSLVDLLMEHISA